MEFEQVWRIIRQNLRVGNELRNWTVDKGYFGRNIKVVALSDAGINYFSPTAKHIQKPRKHDFEYVWSIWEDYRNGRFPRNKLRDATRYSRYIINTFKWLEDAGLV